MSAVFIAAWASTGAAVGAALSPLYLRLLPSLPSDTGTPRLATLGTGITFAAVAWRFEDQFELLPYSALAALGVVLAVIDLIEQRLPTPLTYVCGVLVGALLASSAALHSRVPDLLRAVTGMALLTVFYVVLALASAGNLGAGDVKFGAVIGLATAWHGWTALLVSTWLGLALAALTLLVPPLRRRWRRQDTVAVPFGPFQLAGALVAVLAPSS
ncbi:A24 family peptidase [Allokutzneria sp. A3M-2-11 16]|uniref:prepilin peptidase n=1 Tax=Allokutzneria sp. A3M-2-11 16 TaxID=2962043 RepID=UPI0020B68AE9|nr:A24 family peptidase [Allokutzneria sp. A3M-2-11 16]MCP3800694.1 A24 family peptidase [Allokutzneria sp. A3M-2-11 16]